MRKAREIMGLSRREFEECLGDYGVSMMDERDFESEINVAKEFSDYYKSACS